MREKNRVEKKIIVVGAGVAGLASAIRLAAEGYQVEVFEKNAQGGGKMNQIKKDGFTFDVGPTIVMMPDIYREVFKVVGRDPEDYIPMTQLNPIYTVQFPGDARIDVSTEMAHFTEFLESIGDEAAAGYYAYLAEVYKRYLVAKDHFIERSFRKPSDFYNPGTLFQALKLKTFDSAHHMISKYVKDEKLQKLLSFQTLYIGISPYKGPSIYTIIPMIEMIYGVWFMKGGMYQLVTAMEKLADELGIVRHYNTRVDEIVVSGGRATGIRVGEVQHLADAVLVNADFPYAMTQLIREPKAKGKYTDAKIEKMDYSCSCMLMYLGIDRKLDGLEVHNIQFAKDFDGNISDIFSGKLHEDPSIYLYTPSKMDESLAPEGCEALYVLVPVPSLAHADMAWSEAEVAAYKEKVYAKIQSVTGLEDIRAHVISETIYTPKDFESRFNAHKGATFGLAPTLLQSNYFRPQNKSNAVEGLYFAGSSAHPGAGVPIVLTSAKLAAEEIKKDL